MRIVSLSDAAIRQLFGSITMTDEVCESVGKVITRFGGGFLSFVQTTLYLYSRMYVKATNPDSGISSTDLVRLIESLRFIDPTIGPDQILVADKMDLLYGNDYRSFSEFSKFTAHFYEEVFDVVTGSSFNEVDYLQETLFEDTVKVLEFIMSVIEQQVVFSSTEVDLDDVVIICALTKGNMLYFAIM